MSLMKTYGMMMNEINETTQDFIGELLSDYAAYEWGVIPRLNDEQLNKISTKMSELLSQRDGVLERLGDDVDDDEYDSSVEGFYNEFIALIFSYNDGRSSI